MVKPTTHLDVRLRLFEFFLSAIGCKKCVNVTKMNNDKKTHESVSPASRPTKKNPVSIVVVYKTFPIPDSVVTGFALALFVLLSFGDFQHNEMINTIDEIFKINGCTIIKVKST